MSKIILIILLFCAGSCCNTRKGASYPEENYSADKHEYVEDSIHSLMLLIHSGVVKNVLSDSDNIVISETQIIYCTPSSLRYGYGSILPDIDTLTNKIEWFDEYSKIDNYSIVERELDSNEKAFVKNAVEELSGMQYINQEIVKDDWKFILYVNNIKVASGFTGTLDSFPKKISNIIKFMLEMASPLYPLNGFA